MNNEITIELSQEQYEEEQEAKTELENAKRKPMSDAEFRAYVASNIVAGEQ